MADVIQFSSRSHPAATRAALPPGPASPAPSGAPYTCRAFADGYEITDRLGVVVSRIWGADSVRAARPLKLLNDDEPPPNATNLRGDL